MGRILLPCGDPKSPPTRPLRRGCFQQLSLPLRRVFLSLLEHLLPECSRSVFPRTRLFHSRVLTVSCRQEPPRLLRDRAALLLPDISWQRLPVAPPHALGEQRHG